MELTLNFSRCPALISLGFFVLVLCVGSTQPAHADRFEVDRSRASAALAGGRVAVGITQLHKLAEDGDPKSAYVLGRLFLKPKIKSLAADQKKSLKYFELAAEHCHESSVAYLTKIFYNRRGSEFFAPLKAEKLSKKCNKVGDLAAPNVGESSAASETNKQQKIKKDVTLTLSAKQKEVWDSITPSSFKPVGSGSGVAVNENGLFITNHHVIDGCKGVAVVYSGQLGAARVINFDENLDVATIKVAAETPFFIKIDSNAPVAGETLVALGYPMSFVFGVGHSVTEGLLTNATEDETDIKPSGFLLTSIPVASGNSGGPVLNRSGSLRGIVSFYQPQDRVDKHVKEKRGRGAGLSETSLSLIVSGPRIANWLESTQEKYYSKTYLTRKYDKEELSLIGARALARVLCY